MLLVYPMLLVLALSLLVSTLAYQAPPNGVVAVGWLGDRLFLNAHSGLSEAAVVRGDFYHDDLTPDSPTGRSRWTRQRAQIVLPNLGAGTNLELSLLVQGWPDDVLGATLSQPEVTVFADDQVVGSFRPSANWERYSFPISAALRQSSDLRLTLVSSATFTDTQRFGSDPRPKGIRLAEVQVQAPSADPAAVLPPAWPAVGLLTLAALLLYTLLLRLLRQVPLVFVLTTLGVGLAAGGLALLRIWMGAVLSVALWLLLLALVLAWQQPLLRLLRALLRRYSFGRALGYGLVTAALAWLGYTIAGISRTFQLPGLGTFWANFPDTVLYGLLGTGLLVLAFVLGREGLPRLADRIVRFVGGRAAPLILVLLSAIWLGYQASVIAVLPYVGHADYADNAVVARNIVAGRGWVVDYVTQFYQLYAGLTRPQETWPLLQPLWIAPFVALFGAEAWVVKLPNLIFNAILIALIYHIGARYWDRRVGLVAACITLTTEWFFNLTIFATSDLAFVVFVLGALSLLYRATEQPSNTPGVQRLLVGSGLLTGLLMLQKPSGAVIAVGMGLWLMRHRIAEIRQWRQGAWRAEVLPFLRFMLVWSLPALLLLSPYLARNMILFGKPVYSTESHDAWVLGYRGTSEQAWEDIYRVYAPELGGAGVPDRSWILRWGFDYTLVKFQNQMIALRDYLLPPWRGLPTSLEELSSRLADNQSRNLITPLGAWLAFLGMIVALRTRRRLLGLLAFAFVPYMLFMATYWRTNEERYWVMLVPWLALLAAWMIWTIYDRLAAIGDGRWQPLGLILVVVAIVGVIRPWWPEIAKQVEVVPRQWQPDLIAYEWLERNTAPDTVIMTRIPWQLNWHTERPAVMIPNTSDRELLLELARHYNAEYLVLENQLRVKSDAAQNLARLLRPGDVSVGTVIEGFTLVYASPTPDNRVFIYRFPHTANQGQGARDDLARRFSWFSMRGSWF